MALAGWAVAAAAAAVAPSGNMNGEYAVSSGAGKSAPRFNSDYASKGHEYFDVWKARPVWLARATQGAD
eukprot:scaffold107282_cov60-Phaeocystis_antarctica.AAC.2